MFTRCPDCHTVHPLNAAVLALANGETRCGKCEKRFNALSALYDHWPDASDPPAEHGDTTRIAPVLGIHLEPPGEESPESPFSLNERSGGRRARAVWAAAATVMAILLVVNLAWTFRDEWLEVPELRAAAEKMGWVDAGDQAAFRDPAQIRLVSRDMHAHPTQQGVLVLNATLTNSADRPQAYPHLEVTLLDAANRPLASRVFEPAEYLEPGSDPTTAFAPDVFLPVLLELVDPGDQAVGFQLEFL